MKRSAILILLLILIIHIPAFSHDIQYTVIQDDAVMMQLFLTDGTRYSYESYEIFRPGENVPFQVGQTDAQGRIAFFPDRRGTWRIKAFSEDGHGIDVTLEIDEHNLLLDADRPLFDRYSKFIVGIALIFGLFGFFSIFFKRKTT